MSDIRRANLFGKLNPIAFKAVESATVFCKMRGNPYVELVHWLQQIVQTRDSDFARLTNHFGLEPSRLATDFTAALDRLPRGATSISDFSPHLEEAIERAWVYATLLFGDSKIRTGHLLVGILKTGGLKNVLLGISQEFSKIKIEELSDNFPSLISGSAEESLRANDGSSLGGTDGEAESSPDGGQVPGSKQEALAK